MSVRRSLPAVLVAAWLLTQIPSSTVAAQGAMKCGRFEWGAVGLVPNQTLRASIASVAGGLTVRGSAALLDAQGRILAQTVPVSIGPGAFRSFDFRREAAESGMIGDIRTVISAEAALDSVNKDFY